MQRYFIEMAYDGTNYHGWQEQPNAVTVQGLMNDALRKILRQPDLNIVGAGRTDTGVHANYYVAHIDTPQPIADARQCAAKLNSILPADIAVMSVQPVADDLHSRFSALWRTYHYRITTEKRPFDRVYAHRMPHPLDFDLMNRAAAMLPAYTDFTSFSRLHTDTKTNDCTIARAQWRQTSACGYTFEITANRFLRNMVRAIVGTLFDVGRRKIDIQEFARIIEAKDRSAAGNSADARGLSLVDIVYPEGFGFEPAGRIL